MDVLDTLVWLLTAPDDSPEARLAGQVLSLVGMMLAAVPGGKP